MLTPLDAPDDTEEQHMNTEVPAVLFSAQYMISTPTIPRNTKQISFFSRLGAHLCRNLPYPTVCLDLTFQALFGKLLPQAT